MKPLVMTQGQWKSIRELLHKEHPKSTFMIRDRMRAKLGFTPRDHRHFDQTRGYYVEQVHLDFYSENKKTMFILKFSEILDAVPKHMLEI